MSRNIEPTCGEVRDLLPNYSVGATAPEVNEMIRTHVSQCPDCATELSALNRTGELLSKASLDPAPDLWNAISANLAPRHTKRGMWDWLGRHPFQSAGMVTAAAAMVMIALFIRPHKAMHEDAGNYLAQHASMSWREPFADKAGLGLIDVAYAAPASEAPH